MGMAVVTRVHWPPVVRVFRSNQYAWLELIGAPAFTVFVPPNTNLFDPYRAEELKPI
jgi:hypothetical protein